MSIEAVAMGEQGGVHMTEWNYEGDFNEMASFVRYSLLMKLLVHDGRPDWVNNPRLMTKAAEEYGITSEKIAEAMIEAGMQLKEALEIEKEMGELNLV